jgi:hypothetical protein
MLIVRAVYNPVFDFSDETTTPQLERYTDNSVAWGPVVPLGRHGPRCVQHYIFAQVMFP